MRDTFYFLWETRRRNLDRPSNPQADTVQASHTVHFFGVVCLPETGSSVRPGTLPVSESVWVNFYRIETLDVGQEIVERRCLLIVGHFVIGSEAFSGDQELIEHRKVLL